MTKPGNFIQTTDYATLKNDDASINISVTFPASVAIGASASVLYSQDIVIGQKASIIRSTIAPSTNGFKRILCSTLVTLKPVTIGGSPAGELIVIGFITRISPTTIRCGMAMSNEYGSTIVTAPSATTYIFKIQTFLSPHN